MKRKSTVFSLFSVVIILIAQFVQPIATFAETNNSTSTITSQNYILYKTNQSITINEQLVIEKNSYLYGAESEENNKLVRIQFNKEYVEVPMKGLEKVSQTEDIPEYKEYQDDKSYEKITLSKEQPLYSLYSDDASSINLLNEVNYLVDSDESNHQIVYIGNVTFYVNFEDAEEVKDSTEGEETDPTIEQSDEPTESETENTVEKDSVEPSEESVTDEPKEEGNKEDTEDQSVEEESKQEESPSDDTEDGEKLVLKEEKTNPTAEENNLSDSDNVTANSIESKKTEIKNVNPWINSTAKYFKVTEDNLTVYDNRGAELKAVGKLKIDQVYPRVSDHGSWHRIQFGDIYGYVYETGTVPADGTSLENINYTYSNKDQTFIANNDITVYDNSGGGLAPFGQIDASMEYPITSDYGNWWRIVFADRVGYVNKDAVKKAFEPEDDFFRVTSDNLEVYDNRTGSLVKIGELTKGQVYPRISSYGPDWHKIKFGNITGYVQSHYTESASGESIKNRIGSYTVQDRGITPIGNVSVYDNTSGALVEFAELQQGKSYPKVSNYGNWWKVVVADRVGYVHKDGVRVNFKPGDQYFKVVTQNLDLYDNRGEELKKVGELRQGQTYPIYSDYGNWWRVKFGEIYGYVHKSGTEYGVESSIKNFNTGFTHSKDTRIVGTSDSEIVTAGDLIPFGELTEDTIYPIATDYGNWWRVVYLDRVGYIHKNDVKVYGTTETKYDISLDEVLDIQLGASPQTDKNYNTFVSKDFIVNGEVTTSTLNVRGGPSTDYWVVGQIHEGDHVNVIRGVNGWYQIEFSEQNTWINPSPNDLLYYLNPFNFINDDVQKFQFLDLSKSSDASASVLDDYLQGRGILEGRGQDFIDASLAYGVSDVYLVSHASLETGNGTSSLATGVQYNGKTVYNMYGIGAYDSCPLTCGAKEAYEQGWFTPREAIVGGAKFIKGGYVASGQNTLYKMRWNPKAMAETGWYGKQYATDIGWAFKQVFTMYNLYQQLESYTLYLDIPVYSN